MNKIITLIGQYNEYEPMNGENRFLFKTGRVVYGVRKTVRKSIEKGQPLYETGKIRMSLEQQMRLVEAQTLPYITNREPNWKRTYSHIRTRSNNLLSHNMRVQKTYLLSLVNGYRLFPNDESLVRIQEEAKYIVSHKRKNGLYIAEAPTGLIQEEGPVTAGVIQAFCEMYDLFGDDRYLDHAIHAADSAGRYLKDEKYGYLHTLGYYENTTNVNASFASAYALLYIHTGDEKYKKEAEYCIKWVLEMQDDAGLFLYSTNKSSIYISLYHFLVIIALIKIENLFQTNVFAERIRRALEYGRTLIRNDGTVIEPEAENRYSVLQSASRAALAFGMAGDSSLQMRIEQAMARHFFEGQAYMVITKSLELTDDTFYFRKESALIDVLADLIQMIT